jgi:hypothetical protein
VRPKNRTANAFPILPAGNGRRASGGNGLQAAATARIPSTRKTRKRGGGSRGRTRRRRHQEAERPGVRGGDEEDDDSVETHYGSSVGDGGEGSDTNSADGDPTSGLGLLSVGDSLMHDRSCGGMRPLPT